MPGIPIALVVPSAGTKVLQDKIVRYSKMDATTDPDGKYLYADQISQCEQMHRCTVRAGPIDAGLQA